MGGKESAVPVETLRFIHAANLSLDHQLYDTGPVPELASNTVQEATLISFDRLVSACVSQEVDFLLLVGNSFIETDFSLRAQTALRDGFRRLAEHDIRVFVLPGEADPPQAWRALPDLPDNVVLFSSGPEDPVAVLRDGQLIASIAVGSPAAFSMPAPHFHGGPLHSSQQPERRRTPYSIHLAILPGTSAGRFQLPPSSPDGSGSEDPCDPADALKALLPPHGTDYLALGGYGNRQTLTVESCTLHHPGSSQGIAQYDTGAHGGTVVEVDADGLAQCSFLPTAPVRRERFSIVVEPQTTRDELIGRMQASLRRVPAEPADLIWLVHWTICGTGPLFDSLQSEPFRTECAEWLELHEHESAGDVSPLRCHTWRLLAQGEGAQTTGSPEENRADDRLAHEFVTQLGNDGAVTEEGLIRCLMEANLPNQAWTQRLHSLVAELDCEAIDTQARQLGRDWLRVES
jgi:DNA repair protein SbcD/Mre11